MSAPHWPKPPPVTALLSSCFSCFPSLSSCFSPFSAFSSFSLLSSSLSFSPVSGFSAFSSSFSLFSAVLHGEGLASWKAASVSTVTFATSLSPVGSEAPPSLPSRLRSSQSSSGGMTVSDSGRGSTESNTEQADEGSASLASKSRYSKSRRLTEIWPALGTSPFSRRSVQSTERPQLRTSFCSLEMIPSGVPQQSSLRRRYSSALSSTARLDMAALASCIVQSLSRSMLYCTSGEPATEKRTHSTEASGARPSSRRRVPSSHTPEPRMLRSSLVNSLPSWPLRSMCRRRVAKASSCRCSCASTAALTSVSVWAVVA
mmetsp:Transcript_6159/g.24842  ORF Transcript_6159/g.24842 Transcript_6159/m.24842 type:complete len:316 (-) Transcript_6159:3244-4191(-)